MIRVVLPAHLRTLARVDGEVLLEVEGVVTQRSVLNALETRYPMLCGTIRDHVTELLRWVGLAEHIDALPATLSGGQQQRVAIARAVITRPSLLLADEPTGNLDDAIAVRLMYLFAELNKVGTTIVIATHSERLVQQFTHRQLRIEQGTVRLIPQRSEAA